MEEPTGPWAMRGPCLNVQWARDQAGGYPARDFFDSLDEKDQAKALSLFERLATSGKINNREKFKKVEDGLWEFKPNKQIRLFGDFRPGGRFLIASGAKKQKWRLSHEDLERAHRVLSENDKLEGRND